MSNPERWAAAIMESSAPTRHTRGWRESIFTVLDAVEAVGPVTVRELVTHTGLTKTTVHYALVRLVRDGLVIRSEERPAGRVYSPQKWNGT
jgi:DNA-binding MarR family transcriptional regulator